MSHRLLLSVCSIVVSPLLFATAHAAAPAPTVVEAEKAVAKSAVVYRDARASGGKAAVVLFPRGNKSVIEVVHGNSAPLPPGDYQVTAWIEVTPVSLQHMLNIHLTADHASRQITAAHLAPSGYMPVSMRFLHTGGPVTLLLDASTDSTFPGMHTGQSADEKSYAGVKPKISEFKEKKNDPGVDNLDIEEIHDISTLKFDDTRIACDKFEITPIRLAGGLVTAVDVDKVHYLPGETVHATCSVQGFSADDSGACKLVAELITEADQKRVVLERDVQVESGKPTNIEFDFKLDDVTEFGHELRCTLMKSGQPIHSNNQVFGVSKNVYRVGITGFAGPQDRSHFTEKDADAAMKANKLAYANYFECFAWAPCDYSDMTPKTEDFYSGQTQYHGSVSGFKNLLSYAHKYGIKGITYGKESTSGISGAETVMRHPDWFAHGAPPEFDTFYLERMHYNEYQMDIGEGQIIKWQSWPNWWVNTELDAAIDFGCDEMVRSAKMLGWDGVRWDGHFVGRMDHFNARIDKALPNFVKGYNVAFANPGQPVFLPTLPAADFHEIAKNHGLIMDESIREWSAYGATVRPYYDAICREADYEKRIGGMPLFIEFDRGTHQDATYNVLWGLAAGQRYTYNNTVGDFNAGPLTRFLTRYSAFIWDDTARVKDPARFVHVTVPAAAAAPTPAAKTPAAAPAPWFDESTWLRKLPDGRQQLLVNLVNPPNYPAFCDRVQTPPTPLQNVAVKIQIPAGAKVLRALHLSVDNPDGLAVLDPTAAADSVMVTLPELRLWSIVVIELAPSGAALAYPAYELTTPVEDAAKVLADQEKQKALVAEQAAKAAASGVAKPGDAPAAPFYLDFAHPKNIDVADEKKLDRPASIVLARNGVLDVVHVKGIYSWLNPFDDALGLIGGGNLSSAYATHAGFRLGPGGCLENFPDTYRELMAQDVIILDNTLSLDLGSRRRLMLVDFVKNGGGLVVMGGQNSLSEGMDFNTSIADLLPVKITAGQNTLHDNKGLAFTVAKNDVFSSSIDWSRLQTFTVDLSAPKEGVQIIAKAGDHPAILAWTVGKGRVICFLTNTEGDYADGAKPYWLSSQWTQILGEAVKWAAQDFKQVTKIVAPKRVSDPTKTLPMDLLLNADSMNADTFTKKLNEARGNVDDAAGAATLIQAATENSLKIMDKDLLVTVVEDMEPFIDDSFAPLAEKMVALPLDYFRVAGFTLLRHCTSPKTRPLLESGLKEANPQMVREALAALAHSKDPASVPAIKAYLAGKGTERLLALTALRQMGETGDMDAALQAYVKGFNRTTALMAYRKSLFERLYGGTSFKLTPAERRGYEREFVRAKRQEKESIFDVSQFRTTLTSFTDAQAEQFTNFVVQTNDRAAASISFAALPNFTPAQAKKFRQAMAQAKLPQLRLLADSAK